MPAGAKILHVGEQNDELFIWAKVDSENSNYSYFVAIVPTGDGLSIPSFLKHFITVQMKSGMVWHIFV
jgi:hypothetical protein